MLLIPIKIKCEGYDASAKKPCLAEAEAHIILHINEKGKLRGKLSLPDGWIEHVDSFPERIEEHLCSTCGPRERPFYYQHFK